MRSKGSQIDFIPQYPKITEPRIVLEEKIRDRSAKLGVIGLGCVGLPLAIEMAREGFQVTGIDIDGSRAASVNAGVSYVLDVPSNVLHSAVTNRTLRATQSFAALESVDTISICLANASTKI